MTFLGILIVTHVIDISFAIASLLYIQSNALSSWGRRSSFLVSSVNDDKKKSAPTCWSKGQSILTCCVVGGIEGFVPGTKLVEISLVMFHYFQNQEILDLTPSDLFAALVMVERLRRQKRAEQQQQQQQQQVNKLFLDEVNQNNPVDDPKPKVIDFCAKENDIDPIVVAEGARFLDMAQSIYTWSRTQTIGSLSCNKCTIIYSQLRTEFPKTPYIIAVDHESQSIVVVICKTQSLEEFLSELLLEPKELEPVGKIYRFDGQHKYCNATMLASAEWIYQDLKEQGTLHKILQQEESSVCPN
jgi:hypothetical protein